MSFQKTAFHLILAIFILNPVTFLSAANKSKTSYHANFIYTTPSTLAADAIINIYLAVYHLTDQVDMTQFYVETLSGTNQVQTFDLVLQSDDVVFYVVSTPNTFFSSADPNIVGSLAVQINNRCTYPLTFEMNDSSSVVGFFDQGDIYQFATVQLRN